MIDKLKEEIFDLEIDSGFRFDCHSGLSCYNTCCSELEIVLSPYDILRLKNRLGISSSEFLLRYTDTSIAKETNLPFIKLRMDDNNRCRFVEQEGCSIYKDRPMVCRYYPLGYGVAKKGKDGGDFYFLIKEDFCKGHSVDRQWTVRQWKQDLEIELYEDMNKDWVEIILKKKLAGGDKVPDDKSIRMFFMGSYDVDSFRDFVFKSAFLNTFDLEDEEIEMLRQDEAELMKFAHRWLLFALFKVPTLILKKDAVRVKCQ
ncbi:MAG: YkgJ family cysteine cluster protein [Nitrospirae bacterium]|nr:YkgJ family cysteine cluster protein [Nitrospirota bacterium]